VLGIIRGQVVPDLLAMSELPDHERCSRKNDRVQFRDESEEIGVEGDLASDATVEILNVIVRLEDHHVDGETFRTDFLDPKSHNIAVVEEEELSAGRWILYSLDSLPHAGALKWDFVCWQQAQCQITTKNSLHFVVVVVVVVPRQTMT
jgi:hypothetical protein